jgi:hypothetical protein
VGYQSEFGEKVSRGMRESARKRKCPECGRHAALVLVSEGLEYPGGAIEITRIGVVCRWARDSNGRLCSWPGEFRER